MIKKRELIRLTNEEIRNIAVLLPYIDRNLRFYNPDQNPIIRIPFDVLDQKSPYKNLLTPGVFQTLKLEIEKENSGWKVFINDEFEFFEIS